MSHTPADDGREPVADHAADALRSWAQAERTQADALAQVLEDIAANGLPDPETCVPWEELRDQHLAELAGGQTEHRAA
ncbi:hypothetical protein [Kitasatospora sp. NPDC051914]|uniref:hypothetical protein n=1 Tax=Kitasatospora sp. NPDC051914 TaxID=3154945 RepID=UPI003425A9E9